VIDMFKKKQKAKEEYIELKCDGEGKEMEDVYYVG
jgi:hypothetical protein